MEQFRVKLFFDLSITLCLFLLAMAGCNNEKGNGDNGSASASAASDAANNEDNKKTIVLNDNNGEAYNPVIDPVNFVSVIDNPYFTLTPGRVWVYEGTNTDEEKERVEIEVTPDTKTVMGIAMTVVRERCWENGELVEDTFDWYAQDKDGNVWYFGEDSKDIDEGKVVSTNGSWEAGVNGAKPGVIMKGHPQVGDAYRQEFLKGEAEDMGEVLGLSEAVNIGLGNYKNCVKIKDWNPLEPHIVEHKFYSQEAGNLVLEMKATGKPGKVELIEFKTQ